MKFVYLKLEEGKKKKQTNNDNIYVQTNKQWQ